MRTEYEIEEKIRWIKGESKSIMILLEFLCVFIGIIGIFIICSGSKLWWTGIIILIVGGFAGLHVCFADSLVRNIERLEELLHK